MDITLYKKNEKRLDDYLKNIRPNARIIHTIVIHCSATAAGKPFRKKDIATWHKKRGFAEIGYHFVIDIDGTIEIGRSLEKNGAHVKNHNVGTIGICYIGGLDADGKAADTRTEVQKEALLELINKLRTFYPQITAVKGHRDYSPDLDGDGIIEPNEYLKECPCFDVKAWLDSLP